MQQGLDYKQSATGNLLLLAYALLAGLAAGLVTTLYRFTLTSLEKYSLAIYHFISGHLVWIVPAFVLLAIMGFCTGLALKKYPMIGGSGIPQAKGIALGLFKAKWLSTLIAKFLCGCAAMFAGLSLGREGPSIQLGAAAAQGVGERLPISEEQKRILVSSGASAGLAAAFNAPLSGVIFTLEEIFKSFSPIILLVTMTAAIVADTVSRFFLGSAAIFNFTIQGAIPVNQYWLLVVLGLVLGLLGAFYNKVLLLSVKLFGKVKNQSLRPIAAFLVAGAFALFFPIVIGSGHSMMDTLSSNSGMRFLCMALLLKFLFSVFSYGSSAPGGIFFPLLVMGAYIGAIFAKISIAYFDFDEALFNNLVILAMTGFFTAIVRSPITGIVLLVEMTGSFDHLLPLSVVALVAFVMANIVRSEPIYDSLLRNLVKHNL